MFIEAQNIKMKYPHTDTYAIDGVNLALSPDNVCLLCGASGGGKTTLLSILSGILRPTEGSVMVDGCDMYKMSDRALTDFRAHSFGIIPQSNSLVSTLSVKDNIRIRALCSDAKIDEDYYSHLVEKLNLQNILDSMPTELSGGESKRVSVARALLYRPSIVFADEPTSNLDLDNSTKVLDLLAEARNSESSVFIVSHDPEADKYADNLLFIDHGHLIYN